MILRHGPTSLIVYPLYTHLSLPASQSAAHAERPGQRGDEPAELVAEKVLHQRARFAHV